LRWSVVWRPAVGVLAGGRDRTGQRSRDSLSAMAASVYKLPLAAPTESAIAGTVIQTGSSFGLDLTTIGPEFDANALFNAERVRELQYRDSFFTATNHDHKLFDMNGRMVRPGKMSNQPLLSGAVPSVYVPLDQRRPSTPYRLARKIVTSFSGMVFGYGRFPQFRSDDPATQDWAQALSDALGLEINMLRARNLGGRCGTVGISWALFDGEPRLKVHKGYHCHVLEWEDEDRRIPSHVVELYQSKATAAKGKEVWMWRRRDWTTVSDVVFKPAPVGKKTPDFWEIDQEASCQHDDKCCHFVWIENLPDDDEDGSCDGAPDYAVAFEPLVSLDMLNSVNTQGGIKNLDPTLVLRMDEEDVGKAVVQKGSDNALRTGKDGDAKYLELSGSSISAGISLVDTNRSQILEVTECVAPDPNTIAAAGTSSVALKMVYAPMLVKCSILRYQYGQAIVRILTQLTDYCRKLMPDPNATTPEERYVHVPMYDDDGNEVGEEPVEFAVNLPPKVESVPMIGANGQPNGEMTTKTVERTPGRGRIWLEWGPYFTPTADDDQKEAQALSTAAGAQPVMSQQTAVELHANAHDRDGQEEWARIQREAAQKTAAQAQANAGMFPPIGGEVNKESGV
jgi:hypothetical protein